MRWQGSYKAVGIEGLEASYDAVVVGAGLAGIMAAMESARSCDRVLLVEASRLPREKSCGGMLNAYSLRALEAFGKIPEEMILDPRWVSFRYCHLDRGVQKETEVRFLNVDRALFDEWLLSLLPSNVEVAAGVRLADVDQTVLAVRARLAGRAADGECVGRVVSAEHLIAADGPRATVRERLGLRPFDRYITVQEFVRIQPGSIDPTFDCIYSRAFGRDYGIGYIMPKGDVAIVGSIFYPGTKECDLKHERVLEYLRARYPLGEAVKREKWFAAHLRKPADLVAGRGRILLAGEGGGFLSCTSGEGISFALNSGRMAGRAVAEAHAAHSGVAVAALERYERCLGPMKRNLAFRMGMFPFMNNDACKDMACLVPAPIVSKMTERL